MKKPDQIIKIKRVYDVPLVSDGYRVLVDKLWPRGVRKENLPYNEWAKGITPSAKLRTWFHAAPLERWQEFATLYTAELTGSPEMEMFLSRIKPYKTVTLLYASKDPVHNHAQILKAFIEKQHANDHTQPGK